MGSGDKVATPRIDWHEVRRAASAGVKISAVETRGWTTRYVVDDSTPAGDDASGRKDEEKAQKQEPKQSSKQQRDQTRHQERQEKFAAQLEAASRMVPSPEDREAPLSTGHKSWAGVAAASSPSPAPAAAAPPSAAQPAASAPASTTEQHVSKGASTSTTTSASDAPRMGSKVTKRNKEDAGMRTPTKSEGRGEAGEGWTPAGKARNKQGRATNRGPRKLDRGQVKAAWTTLRDAWDDFGEEGERPTARIGVTGVHLITNHHLDCIESGYFCESIECYDEKPEGKPPAQPVMAEVEAAWDILRNRYEQNHDRRIGHSGFSLITNERMRRFWAEFNEGRYMETRHAWNKEWSKDIMEM